MARIWFKRDGVKWIRERKKTTTFREKRKEGVYEVVEGSRYSPKVTGMYVNLVPLKYLNRNEVVQAHYETEGDFHSPEEFERWLKRERLNLPEFGWLHRVELLWVTASGRR